MPQLAKPFVAATFIAAAMSCMSSSAHAQAAACYANINGRLMHVITGTLESCARTIQATRPGHGQLAAGRWGGHDVRVDQGSNVYVDGQPLGRARNMDGSYGSLSDRCQSGDAAACGRWQRQTEGAIDQYGRMYPRGWNRQ